PPAPSVLAYGERGTRTGGSSFRLRRSPYERRPRSGECRPPRLAYGDRRNRNGGSSFPHRALGIGQYPARDAEKSFRHFGSADHRKRAAAADIHPSAAFSHTVIGAT